MVKRNHIERNGLVLLRGSLSCDASLFESMKTLPILV